MSGPSAPITPSAPIIPYIPPLYLPAILVDSSSSSPPRLPAASPPSHIVTVLDKVHLTIPAPSFDEPELPSLFETLARQLEVCHRWIGDQQTETIQSGTVLLSARNKFQELDSLNVQMEHLRAERAILDEDERDALQAIQSIARIQRRHLPRSPRKAVPDLVPLRALLPAETVDAYEKVQGAAVAAGAGDDRLFAVTFSFWAFLAFLLGTVLGYWPFLALVWDQCPDSLKCLRQMKVLPQLIGVAQIVCLIMMFIFHHFKSSDETTWLDDGLPLGLELFCGALLLRVTTMMWHHQEPAVLPQSEPGKTSKLADGFATLLCLIMASIPLFLLLPLESLSLGCVMVGIVSALSIFEILMYLKDAIVITKNWAYAVDELLRKFRTLKDSNSSALPTFLEDRGALLLLAFRCLMEVRGCSRHVAASIFVCSLLPFIASILNAIAAFYQGRPCGIGPISIISAIVAFCILIALVYGLLLILRLTRSWNDLRSEVAALRTPGAPEDARCDTHAIQTDLFLTLLSARLKLKHLLLLLKALVGVFGMTVVGWVWALLTKGTWH